MKQVFILILILCGSFQLSEAQSQSFDKRPFHNFDFWLGEWTVYKYGTDTIAGFSRITSIIDSLAIQEFYQNPKGTYKGTSLNKYNPINGQWDQFWVDNSGLSLSIRGILQDGKMVLQDIEARENLPLNRITWAPEPKETVRQTWDQSTDGGKSWITVFDGKYVRK